MAKRKRDIQLKFRVTPQEREMIETKMAQFGTTNMAAYLRKMAIDGYVVKLDLPELRELVSLLRYSSNNLNQLTRRAHETGKAAQVDLQSLTKLVDDPQLHRRVCAVHKITDGGLRYAAFHIKLILRHAPLLHQLNQTPADGFIQLQVPHLPSL